jgi:hypothetical protein
VLLERRAGRQVPLQVSQPRDDVDAQPTERYPSRFALPLLERHWLKAGEVLVNVPGAALAHQRDARVPRPGVRPEVSAGCDLLNAQVEPPGMASMVVPTRTRRRPASRLEAKSRSITRKRSSLTWLRIRFEKEA